MSIPVEVFRQTLAELFAPALRLLQDENVSEVLINAWNEIYLERRGVLEATSSTFVSEQHFMSALRNLSQYVGRELSSKAPILEARLPDGARVQAIIPPACPRGPAASIRRPAGHQLSMERLRELGTVTEAVAELLHQSVRQRRNVLVSGGGGTGKTSLLSALVALAKPTDRVVVIEDSQELDVGLPHVVSLESQPFASCGTGSISVRELLRATLRLRPDRIVIGEIRGSEALDLVQAMTSGHQGCLSSVHGTLPSDALRRLETMALMGDVAMPVDVLKAQIASAVDLVVQLARVEDGARRVTHVVEVLGFERAHGYALRPVFECEATA